MINLNKNTAFYRCIEDLIESPQVHSMIDIPHHVNVSCLHHSIFVSYVSYSMCRFLGLDYRAGARGGLLHDLYLYDWKKENGRFRNHLLYHPKRALKNASKLYNLSDKEKDIIVKHMWPLTIKLPKYKESFIVSCADKYCAIIEMLYLYRYMKMGRRLGMARNTSF